MTPRNEILYICATTHERTLADKDRREELVRYRHGVALALRDINANRAALKAWADKWFEGPPVQVAQQSFDINSKIFFETPVPPPELFHKNIEFIGTVRKSMNAEPLPPVTFEQLFDPSIAREAMGRVG